MASSVGASGSGSGSASASSGSLSLPLSKLSHLLQLLSLDSCREITFEQLAAQKLPELFLKSDQFRLGLTLVQLLLHHQPDELVHAPQRLMALAILHEIYKDDNKHQSSPARNPFSGVFVKFLNPDDPGIQSHHKLKQAEAHFLSRLITGQAKELLGLTPAQISGTAKKPPNQPPADTTGLHVALAERESERSHAARAGVPAVVADPERGPAVAKGAEIKTEKLVEQLLAGGDGSGGPAGESLSLHPEKLLVTPAPPLYKDEDDLKWLNPVDFGHLDFLYDPSPLAGKEANVNEVRRLMAKACKGALTLAQQQQLKNEIDKEKGTLIQQSGLTAAQLPQLVEHNPLFAVEVLLQLMNSSSSNSNNVTEYFSMLVNMDMSLHSMEVVNRLTNFVELPSEFVNMYISNCIQTCILMKDKYMQNRYVRLLCVFLSSLVRNKIVNVQEFLIEVQAFCIEFSRIREAAALFKLLRQLESGEAMAGEAAAAAAAAPLSLSLQQQQQQQQAGKQAPSSSSSNTGS